jgi:hypothetical protein
MCNDTSVPVATSCGIICSHVWRPSAASDVSFYHLLTCFVLWLASICYLHNFLCCIHMLFHLQANGFTHPLLSVTAFSRQLTSLFNQCTPFLQLPVSLAQLSPVFLFSAFLISVSFTPVAHDSSLQLPVFCCERTQHIVEMYGTSVRFTYNIWSSGLGAYLA